MPGDQAEQGCLHLDAPGYIKQRAASPECGMQGGEDIVGRLDHVGEQVAFEQVGMALDGLAEVKENRSAGLAGVHMTHRRAVDMFNSGGVVRAQVVPEPIKRGAGVAWGFIGSGRRRRRA